jgi:DNA-binding transcriptional regulator YdaS (Cro superfamily)
METLRTWLNEQRGRRLKLAESLGILPSALSQWTQVPADRVLAVEAATGISRHDLRPDVFGPALQPEAVA